MMQVPQIRSLYSYLVEEGTRKSRLVFTPREETKHNNKPGAGKEKLEACRNVALGDDFDSG